MVFCIQDFDMICTCSVISRYMYLCVSCMPGDIVALPTTFCKTKGTLFLGD